VKKSEAISLIIEKIYKFSSDKTYLCEYQGEILLEELLEAGFPIPCNKKGKFEWDPEASDSAGGASGNL